MIVASDRPRRPVVLASCIVVSLGGSASAQALLNVSYDPTRELKLTRFGGVFLAFAGGLPDAS